MRQYKIDEAIQYSLAQHIDKTSDIYAVTETIVNLYHRMAQRLDPIIGMHGTEVILNRSLQITNKEYPWVVMPRNQSKSSDQINYFLKAFETENSNMAAKASYKLLLTFSQLLAGLIGESLTNRLLNPVLVPETAGSSN
jgi:hypothetical protein